MKVRTLTAVCLAGILANTFSGPSLMAVAAPARLVVASAQPAQHSQASQASQMS